MCLGRLLLMFCNVRVARPLQSMNGKKENGAAIGDVENGHGPETSEHHGQPCQHCESMLHASMSNYRPKPEPTTTTPGETLGAVRET